jgi:acyl carrier protein
MSTDSNREIIRNFIKKNLVKKQEHLEINDQDNIIENGVVDSLGLIKMVNFLEENFSLRLGDEDIVPENFESIESISILLERTMNRPLERR